MLNQSFVSIDDLSKQQILEILKSSQKFKQAHQTQSGFQLPSLKGFVVATCFFESSTRTRLSFESACQRLGGSCIGFGGKKGTSSDKGENLHDTIKTVSQLADLIVLRHRGEGSAKLAANVASVPVINAGDGSRQHPTQTLIDLYSIYESQKSLDGLKIGIAGDLKHARVAHSILAGLKYFDNDITLFPLQNLELDDKELTSHTRSSSFKNLHQSIEDLDILYMTRLQKERFDDSLTFDALVRNYQIQPEFFDKAKPTLKVLHPLPRLSEIPLEFDNNPHAYYFEQVKNGLFVRMVLLSLILRGKA